MTPDIQYIGETLWPGKLAHLCVILSFVAALFSAFAYRKQVKTKIEDYSWRRLGRAGYIIHGIATITLIGLLFYMMGSLMYEYAYVYNHVNDELPKQYILSAFWEGQEGSFLLWMFWHIILGFILIKTAGKFESATMIFMALIQTVLASMLLGLHIEVGDFIYKIGSNPTLLLRDTFAAPIFQTADYLKLLEGTGLNPLLQNYWMTIHPPTLFLGFASVTVPFAFAAGAYYSKEYVDWLKPALKWSLFSAGILGLGILMGGAWAYEALTFGGYWAWDPVENMSLVPWIILVAGVHTNLVARNMRRAINSTFIYYALAFVLVLYSTYLTRSGILGDTSVHSFTEMGLEPQLIAMVALFLLIPLVILIKNYKHVPSIKKEESIYSREFWMFVGALILLFSGVIITGSTSLPVFNSIMAQFDPTFEGSVIEDPIPHYNKFQIWVAILISIMTAKTIHLFYKKEKMTSKQTRNFAIKQLIYFGIAAALTYLTSLWIDYYEWRYTLLTLCCYYTIVANFALLFSNLKANGKTLAAVLGHAGFGLMIIGTVASGLNEETITSSPFVMRGLIPQSELGESVRLIKESPFYVNDYWLTYEGDSTNGYTRNFKVKFQKKDTVNDKSYKPFYLEPNILYNLELTKVAAFNPDTKHYIDKDIFTSVRGLPGAQLDVENAKALEDSLDYVIKVLNVGDTIKTRSGYGVLKSVSFNPESKDFLAGGNDLGLSAIVEFKSFRDKEYTERAETILGLKDNLLFQYPYLVNDLNTKIKLDESTFDNFFTQENELKYTEVKIKTGQAFDFGGKTFRLTGFSDNFDNKNYKAEPEDIAIKAQLSYDTTEGPLEPIFVIRGKRPFNIKDYDVKEGIHVRLSYINPENDEFTFLIAKDDRIDPTVNLMVAEGAPRDDIIVLQAKIFPGINLFWSGSLMMLLGFFIAFLSNRNKVNA